MGAVNTSYTFTANDTITSSKMNNIIDQTIMTSEAIIDGTLDVVSGKLKVKSRGITSNELADGSVTSSAIVDGTIVNDDINASAGITPSKLGSGAIPVGATVTTDNIINASITPAKLNGAQTGAAPIFGIRAWAKLNPYVGTVITGAYKSGTYNRTASSTTVAIANHGLKVNDKIYLNFTTGTGTDGLYSVTAVADSSNFTVDHAGAATSGNVTAHFIQIQASGNISSASWYDATDNRMVLNFTTPMNSVNYATITTGQYYPGSWFSVAAEDTLGTTQLNTIYQAHVAMNQGSRFCNVMIIE